jgi:hypothetical protein
MSRIFCAIDIVLAAKAPGVTIGMMLCIGGVKAVDFDEYDQARTIRLAWRGAAGASSGGAWCYTR